MWRADISAPYTKQTYNSTPAPNAYFDNKKKDDIKARLLAEEVQVVSFGSRDNRPCNKPIKAPYPGPGNYINIFDAKNSSVGNKTIK